LKEEFGIDEDSQVKMVLCRMAAMSTQKAKNMILSHPARSHTHGLENLVGAEKGKVSAPQGVIIAQGT
jgi:hypothetical protein